MSRDWTELEIAAFVDGELDDADARRIAAVIESDPEAKALADRLSHANSVLRAAFDAPMDEEPPNALTEAILEAPEPTVVPLRPRRPTWIPTAIAAGVALAVGLGAGAAVFSPGGQTEVAGLAVGVAPEPLSAALESTSSGGTGAGVRLVASFVGEGHACREFEVLDSLGAPESAGVACRDPRGSWTVLAVAALAGDDGATGDEYVPASAVAWDTLAVVLDAVGANAALSPTEEAARIASGWR